ncbi:hypothetical protein BKA64DRAFT_707174 [Cadophora sp. MPI-SDFR-AT-0126]|nr:hypothetical protein BKA64DRAFT_707174 [Leotiomycetes sp. MPI-SDFR-AT-0126]
MNLRELEDFLKTQEIAFTSILKATKNIDPVELKRSLTRHHAQMIMIAGERYPLKGLTNLSSPSPSPLKPPSANKRHYTYDSDSEDPYYAPSKPKAPTNRKKTPNSTSSSGIRAFSLGGRLQPAGASNLFKNKPSYTVSQSGLKDYKVIDISSDEGSDSEFAEAQENSNFEGSDNEGSGKKKPSVRKGVAVRKTTPATKNTTPAKNFLSQHSDESEVETGRYSKKKGESNGENTNESSGVSKDGKDGAKNPAGAVEIDEAVLGIQKDISNLEASLTQKQAELTRITNVLARQPVLAIVRELKQSIQMKKALLTKDDKSLKSGLNGRLGKSTEPEKKSMAATVEDASESDSDTLFKAQTPTRGSASKRRRV